MNESIGSKTEMADFSAGPCNPSGTFASAADPLHCLEQISNLPENGLGPSHPNANCAAVFPTVAPNYGQYHQLACAYAASLQFGQFVANGNADPSSGVGCVKKSSGRQTYTPDQKRRLEEMFQSSAYVSKAQRQHLADMTKLSDKQIKIWFQNRRMKRKKQETGVGQQTHHQGDEGASTSPSQQQSPMDSSSFVTVETNGVKSEPENGNGGGEQQGHHHLLQHGAPLMFKTDPRGMKVDTDHAQSSSSSVHPLGTVPQSPHGNCLPSSAAATPLTAMPFFNYYQYGGGNYGQHLSPYYPATMFGMNPAAAPPQTTAWTAMESGNGYISSRGQL
ncbi:hypothetical protein niasHT_030684 [Heterodera trifolii]|uniref:Homeobox domain-containing protein n=1 Tax=Heterodera trifolii TaxID=157864 RepID=A0ABD2HX53_9BILA